MSHRTTTACLFRTKILRDKPYVSAVMNSVRMLKRSMRQKMMQDGNNSMHVLRV